MGAAVLAFAIGSIALPAKAEDAAAAKLAEAGPRSPFGIVLGQPLAPTVQVRGETKVNLAQVRAEITPPVPNDGFDEYSVGMIAATRVVYFVSADKTYAESDCAVAKQRTTGLAQWLHDKYLGAGVVEWDRNAETCAGHVGECMRAYFTVGDVSISMRYRVRPSAKQCEATLSFYDHSPATDGLREKAEKSFDSKGLE
jgi:hypothetical protein